MNTAFAKNASVLPTIKMIFIGYSIFITIDWIILIVYLLYSLRKIKFLSDQPLVAVEPSLAVIIAVRNEEEDVEKALQSVLNINYRNHRIIVVNDRSTDRTAEILSRFNHPKLSVITIQNLPDGWLGKNNALYQGYLNSDEEWLLFTDADIEFHPNAISKSFGYVEKHHLDHLSILPEVNSRSTILNSVLSTFYAMLMLAIRPWDAPNPKRSGSIGVGAFNLVKRTAYEKAGTHERIKLRPDDDLKLGLNIKKAGLRQHALSGRGYLHLEWYKTLWQFVRGLEKNSFSIVEYNISRTVFDVIAILITIALPQPLMFIFGNVDIRLMASLMVAVQIVFMSVNSSSKWWHALMIPFAGFLMAFIILRSAVMTLWQGGIFWRDSFYSLRILKGDR